jgi:hypothetical protein
LRATLGRSVKEGDPTSRTSRFSATPAQPKRGVIPFRRAHERHGEELAFLPAALEIVETPPSPIGRTIGATIILLPVGQRFEQAFHNRCRTSVEPIRPIERASPPFAFPGSSPN